MKHAAPLSLDRLRLKQLSLVVALEEHGSVRKAAAELAMTQSAASKALHEVESILGGPLFDRTSSGITSNALGRCVVRYARLLKADLGTMQQEMAHIRLGGGGRLAVGSIMGGIPSVLVDGLATLRRDQPDISIEITEDTSGKLLALLDQGRLDVVIGRHAVSPNPTLYTYFPLRDEPLAVVVGPQHPLAKTRKLRLQDLQHCAWVVYPSQMPLRAFLERELSSAGMQLPTHWIETASTFATVALLRESTDLAALLPREVGEFFAHQKMLRLLQVPLSAAGQPFGVVIRAGGGLTPVAQRFVRLLIDSHPPTHAGSNRA